MDWSTYKSEKVRFWGDNYAFCPHVSQYNIAVLPGPQACIGMEEASPALAFMQNDLG